MLTPLWAFGVFVLLAQRGKEGVLTPEVAFATLSLLELQQQPAGTLVDAFEHFQTLYRCFERIQIYLLAEERHDYRIRILKNYSDNIRPELSTNATDEKEHSAEKSCDIVSVKGVTVWYTLANVPTLQDLEFNVTQSLITMIVGPVGSGKSTLLKLILGEIPRLQGSVCTSFTAAAYCPQSPWITCSSVRENIIGASLLDESWYRTVIAACALGPDLEELTNGDQSWTGSGGARLSGGQRIRIVSSDRPPQIVV